MIAEMHGKISSSGSNFTDRMEDKLTGDFFGNLRYLPYEKGLKILLNNIIIKKTNNEKLLDDLFHVENQFIASKIIFWPPCKYTDTELDIEINLEKIFIGVEVKYNSGLPSNNQLLREMKVIEKKRTDKNGLLLFISKNDGISEAIKSIDELNEEESLLNKIYFAYITWENIYEIFNSLKLIDYNKYEKVIIEDIVKLLRHKGFEKFNSFKIDTNYNIKNNFFKFKFKLDEDFNFQCNTNIKESYYEFSGKY